MKGSGESPSIIHQCPKGWRSVISGIRSPDRYDGIVCAGMLVYTLILSYLSLFRLSLMLYEYDLAVFNQAFWNTIMHGELLTNSLTYCSQFGLHFSPVLFLLVPVYALLPGPQILLIAQSLLLALGAIPLYLYARMILGGKAGCLISFVYLLYPALHGVNLFEFHEVAFIPLILGFVLYGYLTDRARMILLFGILSLGIKEDMAPVIVMVGLAGLYVKRHDSLSEKWHYLALVILSLLTLAVFFLVIKPAFAPVVPVPNAEFLHQYLTPVSSATDHIGYKADYLLKLFLPVLGLSFLAPEVLVLSLPSFLEILLAKITYYSIWYHYSALVIPVIFFAMVAGLSRITSHPSYGSRIYRPLLCLLLISSILCTALYSPAVTQMTLKGNFDEQAMDQHRSLVQNVIAAIPDDASISTQYNLLPFVSTHRRIQVDYTEGSDIILIDSAFAFRAKDFNDNAQAIASGYDCIFDASHVKVYVNKNNRQLKSELNSSFHLS